MSPRTLLVPACCPSVMVDDVGDLTVNTTGKGQFSLTPCCVFSTHVAQSPGALSEVSCLLLLPLGLWTPS